jgi:predicted nucleotidyltransferase
VGLIPSLRDALRPFAGKIVCAFVYGSIARHEEHATSDVDLMVIGTVGLGDLAPSLRKAEKRLGREVNVSKTETVPFFIQSPHFGCFFSLTNL